MYRYLALMWNGGDPARAAIAAQLGQRLLASAAEWVSLNDDVRGDGLARRGGLAIFHRGARAGVSDTTLLGGNAGAVFGTIFRSDEPGRNSLDRAEHGELVESGGASLLRNHWGRYVAIVRQPSGRISILRDPTGGLPCLLASLRGMWVLCSDAEDAVALGLRPTINWPYVAALVADFAAQARETGLEQLTEVQPGEAVELEDDRLARRMLWEPLRIARADPIESPAAAIAAMRDATRQCVHAWASLYPCILHRLSGGLDSAIVLAALREAPTAPQVTCLNYFGAGPQEDERVFARHAAALGGFRLMEQPHEPERVRLDAVLRVARTPRPYFYLYAIEHGRFEAQLAASLGATALFSGAGGDGLFYRNRAALAAADALQEHGLRLGFLRSALDAAIIERVSVWSVLGPALRSGVRHALRVRSALHGRDLSRRCRRFEHPWLTRARDAPPGKVWQVRSIGTPLPYYDPLGKPDDPEAVHPLLSQPLIEVCLRIPTYTLVSGGRDRAIARRAFARDIPGEILRRRGKGASTVAAKAIFETNAPFLRELLLDGLLVRERLLDRARLEQTLAPGSALRSSDFVPLLLQYLAIEAWLRRWAGPSGEDPRSLASRHE